MTGRLLRVSLLCLAALLSGGATDAKYPLPPYSGAYEPKTVDERGLWMQLDEAERAMRDSAFVIRDTALTEYIRHVLCRTVGEDRCHGTRVYVMRVPEFNASMAPNGMLIVNSGLLIRIRDEAELAAILGHEFAHFEQRHTLQSFQHRRSMTDVAAWASLFAGSSSYQVRRSAVDLHNAAIGSIFAFDRDEEREADLLGAKYMLAAGYDPEALPDLWNRNMDEADATAFGRKQHGHRYDRVSFFADHPTDLERATYLRKLADGFGHTGEAGRDAFREAMKPWREAFLSDQVKLNDFGGTEYLLTQLAADGWTSELLYARGELYRTRGNPRDLVSAIGFYRDAIAQDPANAEAYRGMGLAQLRSHDPQGADALKRYLALRPGAPDSALLSTLLQ